MPHAYHVLLGLVAGVVGGWLGLKLSIRLGLLGVDVYKPWRREKVPEAAGFGLALMLSTVFLLLGLLEGMDSIYLAAALLTLVNALIGFVDDARRLDAVTKPVLTMSSASVVLLVGGLEPRVYIPFFGWARLTVIYPFVLPLVIGVSANAFNMIDVVNGVMPTAAIAVLASLLASSWLMSMALGYTPPHQAIDATVTALAGIVVYLLLYNRYPAKAFNGDSGSLAIGALVGYLACALKQEAVYLVAITPLILNGFQIVATLRGFAERREIPRPTHTDERGLIRASCNPSSPPTLMQLLTLETELNELEVYVCIALLMLMSALSALAAAYIYYYICKA